MSEYLSDYRLLLYILAIFRVTMLLSTDNGPWDVFDFIRYKLGVRSVWDGKKSFLKSDKLLGRIIMCPNCLSFYVIFFVMSFYVYSNIMIDYVIYFLGIWGLLYLMFSFAEGKKEICPELLSLED